MSDNENSKLLENYQYIVHELMHCFKDHKGKCTVKQFLENLELED